MTLASAALSVLSGCSFAAFISGVIELYAYSKSCARAKVHEDVRSEIMLRNDAEHKALLHALAEAEAC